MPFKAVNVEYLNKIREFEIFNVEYKWNILPLKRNISTNAECILN